MLTKPALLVPHLPTLLVDEHRGHRTEMLEALAAASQRFRAEAPEVAVVLSARWETGGPFAVDTGRWHGTITDYHGFGVEIRYDSAGHPALALALVEAGRKAGLPVGPAQRGVDSGVTVPLHFLAPHHGLRVVPIGIGAQPAELCRAWGAVLRRAIEARPERIAFVVGGLLSWNEHAWSLRREVPETRAFDEQALASLSEGNWGALADAAASAGPAQPEAGLRHLEVLRGFLGADERGVVRCYESGPGVGAALVEFELTDRPVAASPGERAT